MSWIWILTSTRSSVFRISRMYNNTKKRTKDEIYRIHYKKTIEWITILSLQVYFPYFKTTAEMHDFINGFRDNRKVHFSLKMYSWEKMVDMQQRLLRILYNFPYNFQQNLEAWRKDEHKGALMKTQLVIFECCHRDSVRFRSSIVLGHRLFPVREQWRLWNFEPFSSPHHTPKK